MARLTRLVLIMSCLFYFTFCIVAGMEVSHTLHDLMIMFFLVFAMIVLVRYLVLISAALREKLVREKNALGAGSLEEWEPSVSIIVPAFNEEGLIASALTSLVKLDYPDYEIIVVDDGSTDGTLCVIQQIADRYPERKIRIISQSNAGKSWALNTGIIHAQGELIVCVDSDSKLNVDALRVGVEHFRDPQVGAIGGFVDIINTGKMITRLQQLEYLIGLNFIRRGLSMFNIVTVVPGPIGMFRKEAMLEVGAYNTLRDCFAEDADLTVRLLAAGWRVQGETRMIARTEAPETLYSLLRQRYRWKRGIFQASFNNLFHLVTSSDVSRILVAGILVFESFLFDIINFGITLFALASFLAFGEIKILLWAIVIISTLDLFVFLFACFEQTNLLGKFWLFTFSKISYAYMLQAWGVYALFDECLSTKMSWDKLERIGGISFNEDR